MRIALIGLAALLPALASGEDASPAPYVLHQGRAVREEAPAGGPSAPSASRPSRPNGVSVRQVSSFGSSAPQTRIVGGRSSFGRPAAPAPAPRAFRGVSSRRRGIMAAGATPADSTPPAYAVPGAKIISAGQPPVYSEAAGGGTHSVEGGGFIAIDQSKAHDVGRAPGITWAPPDTPPGRNPASGGGGTGVSANGPSPVATSGGSSGSSGGSSTDGSGGHISGTGNGGDNNQGNNGQGNNGQGNNGGGNNNMIGFDPAF